MYIYGGIQKETLYISRFIVMNVHIYNSLVKSTVFCTFVDNYLLRN